MNNALLEITGDVALPLDVAGEAIAILATRGAGKSYTSAALVEELYVNSVQTVVIDPTGVYWGLRSNAKGNAPGLPIIVLGGAHGDVPLQETAGKLIADVIVDTGQSLVLDLSDFESDGAQCRFMTDFAERLYRRKARSRSTLHLVVDEADEFAPQRPQKNEARMLGAMAKFVRRGRSRGIGLTLITQRSASINKNLLDLVETMIIMRMLGPRDRDAIDGWIKHKNLNDEHGVLRSLPALPTGTAWIWSPLRDILKKVAIRRITTFDSYVTPKPGEVRVAPTALAKVDIEQLGQQIKATAERAKAEDPAALHKKIAELERRLGKPPAIDAAATEAVIAAAKRQAFGAGHMAGYATARAEVGIFLSKMERPSPPEIMPGIPQNAQSREKYSGKYSAVLKMPPVQLHRNPSPAADGTKLPTGERAILVACVQHGGCSREQLTVMLGFKRSTRDTYIQRLRERAMVAEENGRIRPTQWGRNVIGDEVQPLPTGEKLRNYWMEKLPGGESHIFKAVIDAFPESVKREDLDLKTGFKRSTRDTYIQRLTARGVIKAMARGFVIASPILFE